MSSSGNGVSNEQLMAYYEELGNFYCDLEADGKEDNDMEAGHPTDHSRKALQAELDGTAAELRDAHIEIAFLKKSIEKLQSLQATLVRVASNPTIQAHVELARKEFAEGRSVPLEQSSVAPSLPEEGGQPDDTFRCSECGGELCNGYRVLCGRCDKPAGARDLLIRVCAETGFGDCEPADNCASALCAEVHAALGKTHKGVRE